MYIPKVGDVLITKNGVDSFKILNVVDNFITYISFNNNGILGDTHTIFNFSKSFPESYVNYPKVKFEPLNGQVVYCPLFNSDEKFSSFTYSVVVSCSYKFNYKNIGMLFATKEEAIDARDKMLKAIQ
jgi:hypothetical protein